MGVYIKGMEMPTSCDECRIMMFEDTNCLPELFCGCPIVFNAHPQGVGHRPDYCPLVEVPPHGRLIDADNFDERIRLAGGMCEEELTEDFKDGIQTALAMMKTQPTVIPAEGASDER